MLLETEALGMEKTAIDKCGWRHGAGIKATWPSVTALEARTQVGAVSPRHSVGVRQGRPRMRRPHCHPPQRRLGCVIAARLKQLRLPHACGGNAPQRRPPLLLAGAVEVEGPLSAKFYEIRDAVYGQYSIC